MATIQQKQLFSDEILGPVGDAAQTSANLGGKLTGFLAMEGRSYSSSGGLMVVGRAVNGWMDGYLPEEFADRDIRENHASDLQEKSVGQSCPMTWVTKQWGATHVYNSRKSAFWRVIKQVTERLEISKPGSEDWPSHLIHSNLYKLSPAAGRNPGNSLVDAQLCGCKQLFKRELQDYCPKYLLLLTGKDWAEPFLDIFQDVDVSSMGQYVCCTASWYSSSGIATRVVVAVHPQGKPEQNWVDEVIQAMN